MIETLLVAYLKARFPGARLCTELPADLATVCPVIQVQRIGGGSHDDAPALQMPMVTVDSFATSRAAAVAQAEAVDSAMRRLLPGTTVNGAVVGQVRTISGPSWRPWDDTTLRRFGATYQLWVTAP